MKNYEEKLDDLLDILNSSTENATDKFNTWELEFLERMSEKIDEIDISEDLNLTDKQEEKISELWEKYCG